MADFSLDGRTRVKTLKKSFKENFGATIRVYTTVDCKELANDDATLASVSSTGFASGNLTVKGNTKVSTFEKKMAEQYGIGVQVTNADDTEFADDAATLMSASTTASAESGVAHLTTEDLTKKQEETYVPKVQATEAELASARVRVYGQAQNRTALGILHAYMVMYPHATLEDLRKAFPSTLNPAAPEGNLLMYATQPVPKGQYRSYFDQPEELLTMGDGKKVQLACLWTVQPFEALVAHAKQYGILIADFEKAAGGAKKGGFRLEYLNGYVPPVPVSKKKSKKWLWIILIIVALLIGLMAYIFGSKQVPQFVEKVVEKEKIVTVKDTVYVQQLEEIERNFNAAQFLAGKSDLSEDAKFVLYDLAKMMQKNPQIKLRLVGHTSAEGDPVFNQKLSEARAQAAVDFLISRGGIEAGRLEAEGKGSSELKNSADPTASENRRTEFEIID